MVTSYDLESEIKSFDRVAVYFRGTFFLPNGERAQFLREIYICITDGLRCSHDMHILYFHRVELKTIPHRISN